MSPQQIFDRMELLHGHTVRIAHGGECEAWGIQIPAKTGLWRLLPRFRVPILHDFGNASRRIDNNHPVVVEFCDLHRRRKNEHSRALGRLRRFMDKHGFAESDVKQTKHSCTVTFEPRFAATQEMADSKQPRIVPTAESPPIEMQTTGPKARPEDIADFERKAGITLPPVYRGFLLAYNGGEPLKRCLIFSHGGRNEELHIDRFLSLKVPELQYDLDATLEFQQGSLYLPEPLIPIAFADEDVICLVVSGEERGRVYLWTLIEGGFDKTRLLPLAESFEHLVEMLSESEEAI